MSSQALEKFKTRLHGILMNESEAYREEVSNLQTHTFSLNLKTLEKEILQQDIKTNLLSTINLVI